MEILVISDTHSEWSKFLPHLLPQADLVLIAGDLTESGAINPLEIDRAERWLTEMGRRYPRVFWIPGNHDVNVHADTFTVPETVTCILDKTVTYSLGADTVTVHGVSCSPAYDSPQLAAIFDYMTVDPDVERSAFDFEPVDIVVSHCPPFGIVDGWTSNAASDNRISIGSRYLADYINRSQPRLVVCGHIHEAHGQMQVGPTTVINTAKKAQIIHL